jgi:predicted nucleic acid-binding protein
MITYLDTSALVKLFVEEKNSDQVRKAVSESKLVVTHEIAYVEACAAFARLARMRGSDALFTTFRKVFDAQWKTWEIVKTTETLVQRAADLAARFSLRGYDSLPLAAAESTFEVSRGHIGFQFAVYDVDLADAAKHMSIPLLQR